MAHASDSIEFMQWRNEITKISQESCNLDASDFMQRNTYDEQGDHHPNNEAVTRVDFNLKHHIPWTKLLFR